MSTEVLLPPISDEPKPTEQSETLLKRTGSRRFSTRSALRSRGRRLSGRRASNTKQTLPKIEKGDKDGALHLNLEIQRQKFVHALESPNVVLSDRSILGRKFHSTAISNHTKFLSQSPSRSYDYPGKSPYAMENDSVHKYFMSGYQGNVPRYRFLVGSSFPALTHDALNEFTDGLRIRNRTFVKPVDASAPKTAPESYDKIYPASKCILYRSDTGIIPNYKGHIPGHKFRFGRTFGEITKDARGRDIYFSAE